MPETRNEVFQRVFVDHLYKGLTRVTWQFRDIFCAPGPYSFQLQRGDTGNAAADDWENVGPVLDDVTFLLDDPKRLKGTNPRWHYRIRLATPAGTFFSKPAGIYGTMSKAKWLEAREIIRLERLRFGKAEVAKGWLLKRKLRGVVPDQLDARKMVRDPITREILTTRRADTAGTEFEGGYYAPTFFRVDMMPAKHYEHRDEAQSRGTVDDLRLQRAGRFLPFPPVAHNDVFVHMDSDLRYYIHEVENLAEIDNVPILAQGNFKQAPFDDVIYDVPVPEIDPSKKEPYCG